MGSQEESPDNILCKGDGGGPLVCQEQGSEQHVLNGIIAFGVGCGNKEIPDVFASVHSALCFIDYDVKCKHGEKYISHFDYHKDCETWFSDEKARLEKLPLKALKVLALKNHLALLHLVEDKKVWLLNVKI